ncbi:hypothetical protein [Thioalkalivibrio sp. ALE16]|uniref:hypothetical protein n=1 Tax=Thioalkalivibrio sp. ALE16 TaxID=1158172 RepID=UPI000366E5C1|nr:hypothetical protein [Thioalkalivibrio sp. ALE16]
MKQGTISSAARARQEGFTLIGMLLALSVAVAALPLAHKMMDRSTADSSAKTAGNELAQLSVGLRGYIGDIQAGVVTPTAGPVDLDHFRPESCGGPARGHLDVSEGYIPCHIARYGNSDTIFGTDYDIEVNNFGTDGWEVRAYFDVLSNQPDRRGVLAHRVINTASAHSGQPANGLFQNFLANVPVNSNDPSASTQDPADPDFGRAMVVASNRPSDDMWLRTDGSNEMNANIRAGGNSLVNADSIDASGDMVLGNNAFIGGDTVIQRSLEVGQSINSGLNIRADGNLFAGNDVVATTDVVAGDNVYAGNNVVADERVLARDMYIEDIDKLVSQGIYNQVVLSGTGMTVQKPQCPAGIDPGVYTSIQSIAGESGEPIHGQRVNVTDLGSEWRIDPQILPPTGPWQDTSNSMTVVFTKCG